MIRFLAAFLLTISPVSAAIHGSPTPVVPTFTPGAGWAGAATAQPANQGATTGCGNAIPTCGYSDDAIALWDMVPFQTFSTNFYVCVEAYHNNGIAKVSFAVDNGSFVDVTTQTSNGPSGVPEYCIQANPSTWSDGQHEIRAIAYPNYGIPRVLSSSVTATATNGQPLLAVAAHGQTDGKKVVLSGSSSEGFTDGTTYFINGRNADGITPGSFALATSLHGTAVTPSGSGSFTLSYLGTGASTETQVTNGESMWLNTNYNGNMAFRTKYIDPAGTDNSSCGTIGSPCLTIHQAMLNMVNLNNTAVTVNTGSCTTFTKSAHGLVAGEGVSFAGTTFGTGLTSGQLYFVISTNLASGTFSVAATPGGTCVTTSGSFSGNTVTNDVGGNTLYMNAGSSYAYGGSEGFTRNTRQGWLNVVPSPGTPVSNVIFTSSGASGIRSTKTHFTGTLSGTAQFLGATTDMIWFDNTTGVGPGHWVFNSGPIPQSTQFGGGQFFTSTTFSEYEVGIDAATLAINTSGFNLGATPNSNARGLLVNATGTNYGEDCCNVVTTVGDTPTSSGTITFTSLPTNIQNQWYLYGNANLPGITCGNGNITSFAGNVVTLCSNTTGDIPNATNLVVGTGIHGDFYFTVGLQNNQIINNSSCASNCMGEGYFTQQTGTSPPAFDSAIIGNSFRATNPTASNGFSALLLENSNINLYFLNNTFTGNTTFHAGATATDVVFTNNTCVSGAFAPQTGITFIGGTC